MLPGDINTVIFTGPLLPVQLSSTVVKLGLAAQEKSCTSSDLYSSVFVPSGLSRLETRSPPAPTISFFGSVIFTSNTPKSAKNSVLA